MTDKELLDKAIVWLKNIADDMEHITSGNVSHQACNTKGKAIRAVEYLEKHRDSLPEEPVPTPHKEMDYERWKMACEAASCDANYRSHFGLTETRDDYFVDGVQWADEHPALTWEDMMRIHKHLKDAINLHLYELQNGIEGQKKVYQNVLDRFLKEKKED